MTKSAPEFCERAAELMRERGKQYDKPDGERSMARTVAAFNAITGRDLTEAEGWLLMVKLKEVRQWQTPGKYHADSAEDAVAYQALMAEALARQEPPVADKLPLLPIVVGGVYRRRDGEVVTIEHDDGTQSPFRASDNWWHNRDGMLLSVYPGPHPLDLVERIS